MKRGNTLVPMPVLETVLCGSLWTYLAIRATYAVYQASSG